MRLSREILRLAPSTARYLLLTLSDHRPFARRLVVQSPLAAADGGDGGDLTLSDGQILRLAAKVPATTDSRLRTIVAFEMSDAGPTVRGASNNSTGSATDATTANLTCVLMRHLNGNGAASTWTHRARPRSFAPHNEPARIYPPGGEAEFRTPRTRARWTA